MVIMAKAPRPGLVKTRLTPPLSPADAAHLYRCFLRDKCAQVRRIPGVMRVVAYTPADAEAEVRAISGADFTLIPQEGQSLGARLRAVAAGILEGGAPSVTLIDSDTPTLPLRVLHDALALLAARAHDVVLGPSEDGGYYLIGLTRAIAGLFGDIPWSTGEVLRATLDRSLALGLRPTLLPTWWDVDTARELERLENELRSGPALDAWWPAHTAFFLGQLKITASAGAARPVTGAPAP